jgi:predicted transcriptional regulator
VNTRERYRKPLLLEEKGKAKGSPSVMKKLQ